MKGERIMTKKFEEKIGKGQRRRKIIKKILSSWACLIRENGEEFG